MHIKVRELLAKAAYHGITRREIADRAGMGQATFTTWKKAAHVLTRLIVRHRLWMS